MYRSVHCAVPECTASPGQAKGLRTMYNVEFDDDATLVREQERLWLVPKSSGKFEATGFSAAVRKDRRLAVPRHYGLRRFGACEDKSSEGAPLAATFEGNLRPYQTKVVDRALETLRAVHGACIVAACGTGKTVMAIAVAVALGRRFVVLVHKEFLAKQWIERLASYAPGLRTCLVQGGGPFDAESDVVVCLIQTALRHYVGTKLFDAYGLVVVDECHRLSAPTFQRSMAAFSGTFRLGLTATPERADKLGKLFQWHLGPVCCTVSSAQAPLHVEWRPGLRGLDPVQDRNGDMVYAATITKLLASSQRNRSVVKCVCDLFRLGHRIIVFSERRRHLERLMELVVASVEARCCLYLGETSKKRKSERDEAARSAQVLFSTYHMGEEGLDLPFLSALVFASPRGNPSTIEQCCGRIARPFDGKPSPQVVVDFEDDLFVGMRAKRSRVYRKLGFSVGNMLSQCPGSKDDHGKQNAVHAWN